MVRLRIGEVDLERREVQRGDERIVLSTIETDLLRWFLDHVGDVVTRDELLLHVWGFPRPVPTRAVDNTIMRLRRKIELVPSEPEHLKTVRGVGYTFEALAPESPSARAAAPSLPALSQPGAFFGRGADLQRLRELAAAGGCVSVLGIGGVGKTTLVRQWAIERSDVRWCALASAREASDIRRLVAECIGCDDVGAGLDQALRDLDGILVLDNVEQAADAVSPLLTQWLPSAAGLTLVLTSRERLRIAAERVLQLEPLAHDSAVALFSHHVAAVGGAVTPSDESDLHAIVDRLDGLPLALELAAARTRVLPLHDLLHALDDARRVLRGDRRDLPDRHRSIDAVVRGSWDALDEPSQTVLCTVAMLVDGFDLDTLEGTVDLGPEGPWPLDLVARLRDHSLVQAPHGWQGDARFHLLEVVRQFADARARQRADATQIEDRIIDWFLARSGRWRAGIHTAEPEPGIQALTRERNNLVALARRSATRRPEACAQLVFNLGWHLLNRLPDAATLALGVEAADRTDNVRLQIANRLLYGRILEWTGAPDDALAHHEAALALARTSRPTQVPIACFHVTSHLGRLHRTDQAVALCSEGLAAAAEHDDLITAAMLHQRLGMVLQQAGRHADARPAFERALAAYTDLGQTSAVPYAMASLARNDAAHGRLAQAMATVREVMDRAEALSLTRFGQLVTTDLAWMQLMDGDVDAARSTIELVRSAVRALSDPREVAHLAVFDATCAAAAGQPVDARALTELAQVVPGQVGWLAEGLRQAFGAPLGDEGGGAPVSPSDHPEARAARLWADRSLQAHGREPDPPPVASPSWNDRVFRGVVTCRWRPTQPGPT